MKIISKISGLLIIFVIVAESLFAQGTKSIDNSNISFNLNKVLDDNITDKRDVYGASFALANEDFSLKQMLDLSLEDEMLALSEYQLIMEEFNVNRPFSNIIKAEQTHAKALLNLYDAYGIEKSDFEAKSHIIIPNSIEEIYLIAVEAEIANIAMYEKFLTYDLPSDVRQVFTSLRNGSIKHLNAFKRQSYKLNK